MKKTETAYFAAGCFWGVQAYFDQVPGVVATEVGYSGGHVPNPTYEQVTSHTTGHAETTKIEFDPEQISYYDLVEHFFRMHDPTTPNRDGPNIGENYRSAIFYTDDSQKVEAEQIVAELTEAHKFKAPIITEITKLGPFYLAEEYHQKFFKKTGYGACHVWPSDVDIRK
jgi:peptide-methionine (S)-S-oxide reductase